MNTSRAWSDVCFGQHDPDVTEQEQTKGHAVAVKKSLTQPSSQPPPVPVTAAVDWNALIDAEEAEADAPAYTVVPKPVVRSRAPSLTADARCILDAVVRWYVNPFVVFVAISDDGATMSLKTAVASRMYWFVDTPSSLSSDDVAAFEQFNKYYGAHETARRALADFLLTHGIRSPVLVWSGNGGRTVGVDESTVPATLARALHYPSPSFKSNASHTKKPVTGYRCYECDLSAEYAYHALDDRHYYLCWRHAFDATGSLRRALVCYDPIVVTALRLGVGPTGVLSFRARVCRSDLDVTVDTGSYSEYTPAYGPLQAHARVCQHAHDASAETAGRMTIAGRLVAGGKRTRRCPVTDTVDTSAASASPTKKAASTIASAYVDTTRTVEVCACVLRSMLRYE